MMNKNCILKQNLIVTLLKGYMHQEHLLSQALGKGPYMPCSL